MPPILPMPLATAERYATHLINWLAPFCDGSGHVPRIQIAGSIRRERRHCADVDIVCIPKVTEQKDMLGQVISRRNHLLEFLQRCVASPSPLGEGRVRGTAVSAPRFISGGEKEGKQVMVQLPKCQLDLWFADETTFGTRLLCRTGSKEHNVWLCQRAQARGLHWDPYNGLTNVDLGEPVEANTEAAIYEALGLAFIDPRHRERDWIAKHIDSGL